MGFDHTDAAAFWRLPDRFVKKHQGVVRFNVDCSGAISIRYELGTDKRLAQLPQDISRVIDWR